MKRYNAVVGGVYDNSVMVEETDGDWVWWEHVEAQCAELLEASEAIVARMDSGLWQWDLHTCILVGRLRAAIAKAKGETP